MVAAFNLGPSFGRRFDNRFIYDNSQPIHLSPDVVFDLQAGCSSEPSSEGGDRGRDRRQGTLTTPPIRRLIVGRNFGPRGTLHGAPKRF